MGIEFEHKDKKPKTEDNELPFIKGITLKIGDEIIVKHTTCLRCHKLSEYGPNCYNCIIKDLLN